MLVRLYFNPQVELVIMLKYLIIFLLLSPSINAKTLIFLSDLEGNGEKWDTFIKSSGCFQGYSPPINKNLNGFKNVQQMRSRQSLKLNNNCSFFFLGDAVDKGNDTIRILRDLVYLKEVYINDVFLVPGNREINKLRWLQEFSKDGKIVPDNFYKFTMSKFPIQEAKGLIASKNFNGLFNKYFGGTFGAPKAMEFRSQELGLDNLRQSNYNQWITTILKSLREDVETYKNNTGGPSRGLLRRYLELSSMVVRYNDLLLSHGYIGPDSLGKVPLNNGRYNSYDINTLRDIDNWIRALNKFKKDNLRVIIEKGHYGQTQKNANRQGRSHAKFAGNDLILYQEPLLDGKYSFNQNSVVLGRNSNGQDSGNAFDILEGAHQQATLKLSKAGINVRVSGHTPVGQSSFIQKANIPGGPVSWSINVDNSAEHTQMPGVANIFKLINNKTFYTSSTVKLNESMQAVKATFSKAGDDASELGHRYNCQNKVYTVLSKLRNTNKHLLYRGDKVGRAYVTTNITVDLKQCTRI